MRRGEQPEVLVAAGATNLGADGWEFGAEVAVAVVSEIRFDA